MNRMAARCGLFDREPMRAVRTASCLALLAIILGAGACGPAAEEGEEPKARPAWKRKFRGETISLAADQSGRLLVVATTVDGKGSGDNHIYALNDRGTVLWHEPQDNKIAATAVAGDGSLVLAYFVDGTLRAWDGNGDRRWEKPCVGVPEISATGDTIVCWNTGEEAAGGIALEALDGNGLRKWTFDDPGGIWDMSLADDGSWVAAVTLTGEVILLDGQGRVLWKRELGTQVATVAMISGDEVKVAVGTGIEMESLRVYDREGEQLWMATVPGGADSVGLSRRGEFIVTGNNTVLGQRVFVFDADGSLGWKLQLDRPARAQVRIQISADGDRVVAVLEEQGHPTILIWDAHGDVIARMQAGDDIVDFAASRDATRVALITSDSKILYFNPGRDEAGTEPSPHPADDATPGNTATGAETP